MAAVAAFPTREGEWLNLDVASGDWASRPSIRSLRPVYPGCVLVYLAPGVSPQADLVSAREALREANIALRYRRATNYLAMGYSVAEVTPAQLNTSPSMDGTQAAPPRVTSGELTVPYSLPPTSSPVHSRPSSPVASGASSDQSLDWLFASEEPPTVNSTRSSPQVAKEPFHQSGESSATGSVAHVPARVGTTLLKFGGVQSARNMKSPTSTSISLWTMSLPHPLLITMARLLFWNS